MSLTYDDFRAGEKLFVGKLSERFYFNSKVYWPPNTSDMITNKNV